MYMILCVPIVLYLEMNDLGRFGEGISAVQHNLNTSRPIGSSFHRLMACDF